MEYTNQKRLADINAQLKTLYEEALVLRTEQLTNSLINAFKEVPEFERLSLLSDCFFTDVIVLVGNVSLMFIENDIEISLTENLDNAVNSHNIDLARKVVAILNDGDWHFLDEQDLREVFRMYEDVDTSASVKCSINRANALDPSFDLGDTFDDSYGGKYTFVNFDSEPYKENGV